MEINNNASKKYKKNREKSTFKHGRNNENDV